MYRLCQFVDPAVGLFVATFEISLELGVFGIQLLLGVALELGFRIFLIRNCDLGTAIGRADVETLEGFWRRRQMLQMAVGAVILGKVTVLVVDADLLRSDGLNDVNRVSGNVDLGDVGVELRNPVHEGLQLGNVAPRLGVVGPDRGDGRVHDLLVEDVVEEGFTTVKHHLVASITKIGSGPDLDVKVDWCAIGVDVVGMSHCLSTLTK